MPLLFVFDMDDVLYRYDWRVRMGLLEELTGHDLVELRRRWWHDDGEWRAEAGGYATAGEYHAAFETAMGMPVPVDDWLRIRRAAMTPWPESFAAVRRAAELGEVALLTNNGPLVEAHLATLAPEIAELFGSELHTSSFYGARKPDPGCSSPCWRRTGASRRRCSSPTTCRRTWPAPNRWASPHTGSPTRRRWSRRSRPSRRSGRNPSPTPANAGRSSPGRARGGRVWSRRRASRRR
ncbi:HAD family hydrolase [Pseudolysinimonas kribbensis]|uniref:HAD family hydrolase n=1 Tax=Pseudolysinimonas kribbensis TaxID=433641 RepID=UPI0024E0DFC7|nr:HAD family hydrolase [Pseudolysinimonas kribbensis]